ncbi:hypothetical protein BDB01DRAFT_834351 [Pilobolus umbonatus]|nr:hypothetical protein BDB01DRAFT_834351 [Pilobolus umbonatus]
MFRLSGCFCASDPHLFTCLSDYLLFLHSCSGYIPDTKSALKVIFFAYRLLLERVEVGAAYSKCRNDLLCMRESLVRCYLWQGTCLTKISRNTHSSNSKYNRRGDTSSVVYRQPIYFAHNRSRSRTVSSAGYAYHCYRETYAVEVYPTYFATTGPLGIADHIQNRVTTSPFHSLKTIMSDYTGRYSLSTAQSLSINYSHTIYFP